MKPPGIAPILLLLVVAGGAHARPEQARPIEATVEFVGVEGGCYRLRTANGNLEPVNLPEQFREQGLRVSVVTRPFDGATICMTGKPVEILRIERIKPASSH